MALEVVGEAPGEHFSDWSRALSREQVAQLDHLLNKRIESRKPLAYLLGHAWFAGIRFAVNENVLVPRSPLAELIEEGFAPWLDMGRLDREQSDMGKRPAVLDLCTGSGCLELATAWYWPQLRVDCTDISSAALEVAELNRQQLGLQERVQLLQSDLFSALEGRSYDLIAREVFPHFQGQHLSTMNAAMRAQKLRPELAAVHAKAVETAQTLYATEKEGRTAAE